MVLLHTHTFGLRSVYLATATRSLTTHLWALRQVGPGVDVLCKVRARPCDKAVTVMQATLQKADDNDGKKGGGGGEEGEGDENAARAKRRRLAAFFVESGPSAAAKRREGKGSGEAGSGGGNSSASEAPEVIVAIRKGNIVGTAFHPELTNDSRWHEYFVRIVKEAVSAAERGDEKEEAPSTTTTSDAGAASTAVA